MGYVTPKSRYVFLDVFRGVVVLLMLEGHFIRLVLRPDLQSGPFFVAHEIFHGLTAPAFIFGAGFTFAIASERKGALLQRFNTAVVRRLWRAVLLLFIGYALHLPYYSLSKTLSEATPEQWRAFLQFDVLQLIGFCLIALRLLALFVHNEVRILTLMAVLTLGTVLLTPVVWSNDVTAAMPAWLTTILTGAHGSLFPVFPYAAFLTAGAVSSWGFLRAAREGSEQRYMRRMFLAGCVMIPGGLLIDALPIHVYAEVDFWYTAPSYFWVRLGLLYLLLPLFWFSLRRNDHAAGTASPIQRRPSTLLWWISRLGVESLFVYIIHLLLLYGSVINADANVQGLFGSSLDLPVVIVWCSAFVLLLSLSAYGWNHLKTFHAPLMRVAYWWIGFMWVGEFVVRPW